MRTGENDLASPDSKKEKIVSSYTVAIDENILNSYRIDGWVDHDGISDLIWSRFPDVDQRQRPEMARSGQRLADERRGQEVSPEDDLDWGEIDWSTLEFRSPMAPPNSIAVDGPIYDWLVARGADPEQRINEVLREALKDSQSQSRSR